MAGNKTDIKTAAKNSDIATLDPLQLDPEQAHGKLLNQLKDLYEAGHKLDDDNTYVQMGYPNARAFKRALSDLAYEAGLAAWRDAADKLEQPMLNYTEDDIDAHPIYDMIHAYDWIKRSGKPLFSDYTYKPIGHTRDSFMQNLMLMHEDGARQLLSIAAKKLHDGEADEQGHEYLTRVQELHLKALGIDDITDTISYDLGIDAQEYEALCDGYDIWRFQQKLAITIEEKIHPNDTLYATGIVEAWDIIQHNDRIVNDPKTFMGTLTNLHYMHEEYERCKNLLLQYYITAPTDENAYADWGEAINGLNLLRKVIGEYEPQSPTSIAQARQDYWMRETFQKLDETSYDIFMHKAHIRHAINLIGEAYEEVTRYSAGIENTAEPHAVYNILTEALGMLKTTHVPFEEGGELDNYDVDIEQVKGILSAAAIRFITDQWVHLQKPIHRTVEQLDIISKIDEASEYVLPMHAQAVPFADDEIVEIRTKAARRYAEELFADSLITRPEFNGSYEMLDEAFSLLDDIQSDIFKTGFMHAARDRKQLTKTLDDRYEMLIAAASWRTAIDREKDMALRFDCLANVERYIKDVSDTPEPVITSKGDLDHPVFMRLYNAANMPSTNTARPNAKIRELMSHMGIDDMQTFTDYYRSVAYEIIHQATGNIDALMSDYDREASHKGIEILKQAVDVILPGASQNLHSFKRITGLDLKTITRRFYELDKWWQYAFVPQDSHFNAFDTASDRVRQAYELFETDPAQAYTIMASLARQLRADGDTILNRDILASVGWETINLHAFVYQCAEYAAQREVQKALDKQDLHITAHNWREHAFFHYRDAFNWVHKSRSSTVLHDEPYQNMGLPDRASFSHLFALSLKDYIKTLERLALTAKPDSVGKFKYLDMLIELRATRKISDTTPKHSAPHSPVIIFDNVDNAFIRRQMVKLGPDAVREIIRDSAALPKGSNRSAYQYKRISRLLNASIYDLDETSWINRIDDRDNQSAFDLMDKALQARVANALARYHARPGSPMRGARLAIALRNTIITHEQTAMRLKGAKLGTELHYPDWFQKQFVEHEYADFASFTFERADACMRQIIHRMQSRLHDENGDPRSVTAPEMLTMLREMAFMDTMVDQGLITRAKANILLEELDMPEDKRNAVKREASILAAQTLSIHTDDPTLFGSDMDDILGELEECLNRAGPEANFNPHTIALADIPRIRSTNIMRDVASLMFFDLLGGPKGKVTDYACAIADLLHVINQNLTNTKLTKSLGLSEAEAKYYKKLDPYIVPYQIIDELGRIPDTDYPSILLHVTKFCEKAYEGKLRLGREKVMQTLGFKDNDDFIERVDSRTFKALAQVKKIIEQEQPSSYELQEKRHAIQMLMDATALEDRYGEAVFKAYNAMNIQGMNEKIMQAMLREGRLMSPHKFYKNAAPTLKPANA